MHIDDFRPPIFAKMRQFLAFARQFALQVSRRKPPMEAGTVAFEDIHAAAAGLAERRGGQNA
jgi:hypothetical protein